MSEKKAKKSRVDLDKLDFGLDIRTGVVVIGEADEDGVINTEKAKDVTDSFFQMVHTIAMLQMKAAQEKDKAAKDKAKIIVPTNQDVSRIGSVESYD